jgi:hypothetical protein
MPPPPPPRSSFQRPPAFANVPRHRLVHTMRQVGDDDRFYNNNNRPEEQVTAEFYKQLADRCWPDRVALSIVYHTNESSITQSLDIATMGELYRARCGNLAWILKDNWQETLLNELLREYLAFTGWDAIRYEGHWNYDRKRRWNCRASTSHLYMCGTSGWWNPERQYCSANSIAVHKSCGPTSPSSLDTGPQSGFK